jgi:hypothetical protein
MEMQSTSMSPAQPVFSRDAARFLLVILSAIALIVTLVVALAVIRGQTAASVGPRLYGDREPIELPAAVPGALTAPDHEAGHDALDNLVGSANADRAKDASIDRWNALAEYYGFTVSDGGSGGGGRGQIPQ